jgi:hypothetical protein
MERLFESLNGSWGLVLIMPQRRAVCRRRCLAWACFLAYRVLGDMVCSFEPCCWRCTGRRTLGPLTGQISKTFMALIRFPRLVGTADTDTEKSGSSL